MKINNHIIVFVYCFDDCMLQHTTMETIYKYNHMIIIFPLTKNDAVTLMNMCYLLQN